jgi:hypothetical protein
MRRILALIGIGLSFASAAHAQQTAIRIYGPYGAQPVQLNEICGFAYDSRWPVTRVDLQIYRFAQWPGRSEWVPFGWTTTRFGQARPDIAARFGAAATQSGWCGTVDLGPGTYLVTAHGSPVRPDTGTTLQDQAQFSIGSTTVVQILSPTPATTVSRTISVTGRAYDTRGLPILAAEVFIRDPATPDLYQRSMGFASINQANGGFSGTFTVPSDVQLRGPADLIVRVTLINQALERYDVESRIVRVMVQP